MREIILDDKFKFLLPELDAETFRLLEENILEHGCLHPLVLWNGILIDGYNRYKICTTHNILFDTIDMEFESREEALIWIISNQVSRRNLTPIQLSHFRGLHYKADKKIRGQGQQFVNNRKKYQNDTFPPGSTSNRLSEQYNVSRITIIRDAKLAAAIDSIGEISPEAKRKILSGRARIGKNRLEALASASEEEIKEVATAIESGVFEGRVRRSSNLETSENEMPYSGSADSATSAEAQLHKLNDIISDFANSFNSMLGKSNSYNPTELRAVLRTYIDRLEGLYKSIT